MSGADGKAQVITFTCCSNCSFHSRSIHVSWTV